MRIDLAVTNLDITVRDVVRALNNNLTPTDNFQAKLITVPDTGSADVEFTVTHGLGIVPTVYVWNIDRSGVVYDSRRVDWTETQLFLKCSVANAAVMLLVM